MKGFVFSFDIILGLTSLFYILLFLTAASSPINEYLLDYSVLNKLNDFLIVKNAQWSDDNLNSSLFLEKTCFPLEEECGEQGEWVCAEWKKAVLSEGELEFKPNLVCRRIG